MKAGKIINKGNYGCIVTPAYNCKDYKPNLNNQVSKFLFLQPLDKSEVNFGKILKKIDPHNKHFIYVTKNCKINKKKILNEDKSCIKESNTNINNYILKKGGKDLSQIKVNVKTATKFTKQLLKSIKKLSSNNLINLDIKRQNIITDTHKKNTFIIDFGSAFVFKSFKQFHSNFFDHFDFNMIRSSHGTYIWPPEIFRLMPNYNNSNIRTQKPYDFDDKKFNISKKQVSIINKYITSQNTKIWKKYSEKVMIFSLGFALTNFYNKNITKPKNLADKLTLKKLQNIANGMHLINPYKRYTINQALKLLQGKNTKIIKSQTKSIKIPGNSPKQIKKRKKLAKKTKKTKKNIKKLIHNKCN